MNLFHKMKSVEFLASEFLTWLLFRTERQIWEWGGENGKRGFELWPDDRLRLEAPLSGLTCDVLSGGSPSSSPEARAALAHGKMVQEARWKLIYEDRIWVFTLKAPDLDLRTVKMPELLTQEDDDRLRERITLLEHLEATVEDLYGRFLRLRISEAWDREELPAIARWITAAF